MRILQVVPLVSRRGDFGGPTSVAVAQARALREAGHSVDLAAGWLDEGPPPQTWMGIHSSMWPIAQRTRRAGFSLMTSPGLLDWVAENSGDYDIAHLHVGRHIAVLRVGLKLRSQGRPFVVQTHGMVPPATRVGLRLYDRKWTRPVLEAAQSVLSLTARESKELSDFSPKLRISRIFNAVPRPPDTRPTPPTLDDPVRLIFLGRLASRKRPKDVVRAVKLLQDRGIDASALIAGPDEGEGPAVDDLIRDLGLSKHITRRSAVAHDEGMRLLLGSNIFVLPSVHEPFPMAALEAMSLHLPVVLTQSCGIADELSARNAAQITQPNAESIADAIEVLVADPGLRLSQTANAARLVSDEWSPSRLVDFLIDSYARGI